MELYGPPAWDRRSHNGSSVMNQRLPAIFIGDALGLDFLNSLATPVDTAIDWINDGEGFLNWLEQAHLVPGDVLATFVADYLGGIDWKNHEQTARWPRVLTSSWPRHRRSICAAR